MATDLFMSIMRGFKEIGEMTDNIDMQEKAEYFLENDPNELEDRDEVHAESAIRGTDNIKVYIKDMIKEVRSITISYKGRDADYGYRVAEMGWDSDLADDKGANEFLDYLEYEYGWDVERFSGYAIVEVADMQEYNEFKSDYLEAKKAVIAQLKQQNDEAQV